MKKPPSAVIVSVARTPIGTAYKGSLTETTAEALATHVVRANLERSGLEAKDIDDIILAEVMYGGGDVARHAAVSAGLLHVPGQAVNRHCAGGLTAIANAAAAVSAGLDQAIIAGGVQSNSLMPQLTWRVPGTVDETRQGIAPTFPYDDHATDDVTLSVGWNVAQEVGISREEMDAWAKRSHDRAVAAIDAGAFLDEIVPIIVTTKDGTEVTFSVDEHPRRGTTIEKLATLKPLHPEIDGFSITAGNASGINDAAAAVTVVSADLADERALPKLAALRGWAFTGVQPRLTGLGAIEAARLALARSGLSAGDIDLWEVNEAFASVPVAACRLLDLDEDKVNVLGSGCSLGHPVAATGARMVMSLALELRRRGGGLGLATMCAGGGQGGAMVVEVS